MMGKRVEFTRRLLHYAEVPPFDYILIIFLKNMSEVDLTIFNNIPYIISQVSY